MSLHWIVVYPCSEFEAGEMTRLNPRRDQFAPKMLPGGIICKWHNGQKAICPARILKKLSHTICSLEKFNELIAFCDENAQKFLAKLWFQNLLTAKLSFQIFNGLTVLASLLRVNRGKTMLPAVAKL